LVSGHGSIARLGTSTVDFMSQSKSYTASRLTLQVEERMHRWHPSSQQRPAC
jgi:hypothetical protein